MSDMAAVSPWSVTGTEGQTPRSVKVQFVARRRPFLGLLLGGLVMMVPTLGIYRFWLATRKRQFYWGHTDIDGDPLEYTGTAAQLLVGFLMAVLIFLPIYVGLFYVTVRLPDFSPYAYLTLVPLFYFLMGYAAYRARRFRLSRTLWRGIRFQQSGNAWVYAIKRFLWTLLTIVTLGLTYPLMAKSLWTYRISNTWFGDRRFSFSGKVGTIAWPFYGTYLLLVVLVAASAWQIVLLGNVSEVPEMVVAAMAFPSMLILGVGYLGWLFVSTRIDSRYWSSVSVGAAQLKVRISAFAISMQQLVYALLLTLFSVVYWLFALVLFGGMSAGLDAMGGASSAEDMAKLMHMGSSTFFTLIALYLVFLGLWGALSEMVLGFGYWKIAARGTAIENVDALASVRAAGVESPLAGEGLADALNVGAY